MKPILKIFSVIFLFILGACSHGYGHGASFLGFFHGWGFWLILLIGIVLVVLLLQKKPGSFSSSRAIDILKERYAKGEISKEEYESIKKDLEK